MIVPKCIFQACLNTITAQCGAQIILLLFSLVLFNNSRPDCSGSCPDGSDPSKIPKFLLMYSYQLISCRKVVIFCFRLVGSTPCPDNTFPVISNCSCEDGSLAVEGRGGFRWRNRGGEGGDYKCKDGSFPTCQGKILN